jgi:uncharacterized protein with von Willebrand factor type A (vWA) domain
MATAVVAFGQASMMIQDFLPATRRVVRVLHDMLTSTCDVTLVEFADQARIVPVETLTAEWTPQLVYESNVHPALKEARRILVGADASLRRPRRLVLVLNAQPTAHTRADGNIFFRYPPADETLDATFGEAWRCADADIRCDVVAIVGSDSTSDRTVAVASALARLGNGLALAIPAVGPAHEELRGLLRPLA